MVISKKHKIIFVHINKTGGTSLRDLINHNPINMHMHYHAPAYMIKEVLDKDHPDIWDEYEKISMVRNPYSWQVSMYEFIKAKGWHKDCKLVRKMSFKEYLEYFIGDGQKREVGKMLEPFYMPQTK